MNKKKSYHTNFKIKYRLGMLTKNETKLAPSSTRHYWKSINFCEMIGADADDPLMNNIDFHKAFLTKHSLVKIAKCLWWICTTYSELFEKMRGWKKMLRKQQQIVVKCIQQIAPTLGFKRSCRLLKISYQQFFRWQNSFVCNKSLLKICRKNSPQQLTSKEQQTVKKYLDDKHFIHRSLLARYYQMIHDKAAFMGLQTFYRYADMLNILRIVPKKKKPRIGIRSNYPFELLHMDTTIFRLSNLIRVYIHFIMDNFSRAILGHYVSLKWNSKHTVENLKAVCEKYHLYYKPLDLMCDDGSENKGEVNNFIIQPNIQIKRVIAQIETSFSNSMIEAVNKKIKYDFLFTRKFETFEEVKIFLNTAVEEYNNRYHSALFGITPLNVLNGAIPDRHLFATQINDSRKERILKNKQELCEQCSPIN